MTMGIEMKKVSRRISVILAGIALITVGPLVACGGGDGEEQPDPTVPTTAIVNTTTTLAGGVATTSSTAVGGATTTTQAAVVTDTLVEMDVIGETPKKVPVQFREAYGKRPIVVLFYVPGEVDDEDVVEAVRELRSSYPTYTFLIYDYKLADAYGDLADWIGVGYQPFIALVDRHGVPHRAWSGYVDKGTLNQTLIDLGRL